MDAGETLESKINRSEYKILIVDDVVSNVLLLKNLMYRDGKERASRSDFVGRDDA